MWHEDCALDIFHASGKNACLCPNCKYVWKNTHFDTLSLKETNAIMMKKIEEMSQEISSLKEAVSASGEMQESFKLLEQANRSMKEDNKTLKRDVGKILDTLLIDEKKN